MVRKAKFIKYNITALEKELNEKVNPNDQFEIARAARYLSLTKDFIEMEKAVKKYGGVTETINGSQRYVKENPALPAKLKINAQLANLEETFEFVIENGPASDGSDLQ